jgi:Holliday junction resolvase RusA-like endonuclease
MTKKTLTLHVKAMGKPRMTRQDKWKKPPRPPVARYRAFATEVRKQANGKIHDNINNLSWVAYLPIPESWSQKKKDAQRGQLHLQTPDRDNIDKAILDALFKQDSAIATGTITKRWDDGQGVRIEMSWTEDDGHRSSWHHDERP